MTVLALPAQPGQATAERPPPWRRMAWVTWRQHRALLIAIPAVLGAVALFLLLAGLQVHHDYAAIAACPQNGASGSNACQLLISRFNATDWTLGNTVLILMNLVPALVGAFAGAPLLARELETGTFRYAWTQGLGRQRWTIAKLALIGMVILVLTGAFSQLFAWFFQPFLPVEEMTRLAATVFGTTGVVFAAWTLAAFAIGALAGMLLRRIVPAMAVTLGGYLALALAAWGLRTYYPVSAVTGNPGFDSGSATPSSPWVLGSYYTGSNGQAARQAVVNQVSALFPQNAPPRGHDTLAQALAKHGITQWWRYIPVSRFWPMQLIECGWLLGLSVLLMAATVWLVRRRAA